MKRLLLCDMPLDGLDACLGELAAAADLEPDRRSFLIVPEEAKADAERRYLEYFDRRRGLMMAEVLSFRRFAHRIFSDLGGLAARRLSNAGKALLISRLLSEDREAFPYLGRLGGKSAYAAELSQILGDFSRYGLSAEGLQSAAGIPAFPQLSRDKFHDLALLKERYEAELKRRGLFDGDADFPRLCRLLREEAGHPRLSYLKSARIWVAGFGLLRAFTPQELELLEQLGTSTAGLSLAVSAGSGGKLERREKEGRYYALESLAQLRRIFPDAEERLLPARRSGPVRVEVWRCEEGRSEAAALAGEIRRLLPKEAPKGGPFGTKPAESGPAGGECPAREEPGRPESGHLRRRDIAIAVAQRESTERLSDVLGDFGLDAFISEARPLHESPLFRYLEVFFRLAGGHAEPRDLIALGRSGLLECSLDELDRFENFLLASPVRYLSELEREGCWRFCPEARSLYRRLFVPQLEAAAALRAAKSAEARARFLLLWLNEGAVLKARLQSVTEELEKAARSERALLLARSWETVLTVLEDVVRLLGGSPLSLGDFGELCLSALRGQRPAGIPLGIDRVRLASPAQLLLYPARVLFLCGAAASAFPPPLPAEGLLRNAEREGLEQETGLRLPNYRRDAVKAGNCLSYFLSRLPSERLILSCPSLEREAAAELILRVEKAARTASGKEAATSFGKSGAALAEDRGEQTFRDSQGTAALRPQIRLRRFASLRRGSLPDVRFLSPQLARRALGPALPGESPWKEVWRRILGPGRNEETADPLDRPEARLRLSPEAAEAFLASVRGLSVTRLQRLRLCPYRHFTDYGLELSERPLFQPDPRYRGSFLHAMMEASLRDLLGRSAEFRPGSGREGELLELIRCWKSELNSDYIGRLYNELTAAPAFRNYGEAELRGGEGLRLRRAARDCLLDAAAFLCEEAALPRQLEWSFPPEDRPSCLLQSGKYSFPLRGLIDRIDRKADGSALILDYKSGSKDLSYPAMAAGLDLQLPLYAAVFRHAEPETEIRGLGFFRLGAHGLRQLGDAASRSKAAGTEPKGESQLIRDPETISLFSHYAEKMGESLLAQISEGEISARPLLLSRKQELPCACCPAAAICRTDSRCREARCRRLPELAGLSPKALEPTRELLQTWLEEGRLPKEESGS